MSQFFKPSKTRKSSPAVRVKPTVEALEDRCVPATLTVGPGAAYQYALPSQAAAAARDGDTIQIAAGGNYNGDVTNWTQNNLTIQGVGGRAHIDIAGVRAYGQKGIWLIQGNNTTVENIEFSGAHDFQNSGSNWAGIREEGSTLTLVNDYFHDNDDGILVNAGATSDVTVSGSEFANNGFGDGYSHNMYIGAVRTFTLENSYSHDAKVGHLVKSRALTNYIRYNRIEDGPNATASYEIDLPQAGTSYLIGNVIEQGANSQNPNIIAYGEEGTQNPGQQLYLVNNTVVNDKGNGTFVWAPQTTAQVTLENNIFAGPGAVISTGGSVAKPNNLVSNSPGFVNQAGMDYHLTANSAAIDAGTAPSSVNGVDLSPAYEYVDPLSKQARPTFGALDIGAYEFHSAAVNRAPTVATAAAGALNAAGTAATLSAFGADADTGEASLTYTWTVVGTPPAAVTFGVNDSNAAKNSSATFTATGTYTLQVAIVDPSGASATSSIVVSVGQVVTGLSVTPATVTLSGGGSQTFTASATDQFGLPVTAPSIAWSLASGVGSVNGNVYTAPASSGTAVVKATSGAASATANVTVNAVTPPGGSIVLHISEDAYQGNARYTISVDGVQVGGVRTATALHGAGQSETVTLTGPYAAGSHTVAVKFLNDKWDGTAATDRNLYLDGIDFGGTHYAGRALYSNGTATVTVSSAVAPPPAAAIVLRVSEDAYQGNAQYTITVDGVQVGGVRTATALHGAGQSETVTLTGPYAAGPHIVGITFLNDKWDGTAATDRNLYLDGVDFGAIQYAGGALFSQGTYFVKVGG